MRARAARIGGAAIGWLLLLALAGGPPVWAGIPGFMKARMGSLSGQVFAQGRALPNAVVSFFNSKEGPPPVVGGARRVPDMVGRTDKDGRFVVKLLPGTYFMGALARPKGQGPGPPRPGERYYFMRKADGTLRVFTVKTRLLTPAGRIDGVPPADVAGFNDRFLTIEGRLIDRDGKPLSGMVVTLKNSPQAARPRYIATPSGVDGRFVMQVPPGRYYVMAREEIRGGRPRTGSYIGTYGKEPPALEGTSYDESLAGAGSRGGTGTARQVGGAAGETISGIVIKMFRIPDPEATRRRFEEQARRRDHDKER